MITCGTGNVRYFDRDIQLKERGVGQGKLGKKLLSSSSSRKLGRIECDYVWFVENDGVFTRNERNYFDRDIELKERQGYWFFLNNVFNNW